MKEVLYIIIGSLITFGFQFFMEYWKNKKFKKQELENERKKVYQDLILFINKIQTHQEIEPNFANGLTILIKLYGSNNIYQKYKLLYNTLATNKKEPVFLGDLLNEIRKEIGVKEKINE